MSDAENNPASSSRLSLTIKDRLIRLGKRVLKFILVFYALLIIALVLMETALIYPAPKFPAGGNWNPVFTHENVEFTAADGVKLHSWIIRSKSQRKIPRYVIYCHGNGENVASAGGWSVLDIIEHLDANVMVFDYRGYGKSEGSPHEAGIKLDAERAIDVFCDEMGIKPSEVILVGHSLGGGVATHLAETRGCKALILQKTFSSLPDVAASKYPIVPVRLLMRNRFNSAKAIQNYEGPLFQAHGEEDRVVPYRFGEKLFAKKPTNKLDRFVPLPGIGHNDGFPQGYWQKVDKWLDKVETELNATRIEGQE